GAFGMTGIGREKFRLRVRDSNGFPGAGSAIAGNQDLITARSGVETPSELGQGVEGRDLWEILSGLEISGRGGRKIKFDGVLEFFEGFFGVLTLRLTAGKGRTTRDNVTLRA